MCRPEAHVRGAPQTTIAEELLMTRRYCLKIILGLCLLHTWAAPVNAVCSLTDGTIAFSLSSPATLYQAFYSDSSVGPGDQLGEWGFFFRVSGDGSETPFGAATSESCSGNSGTLTWPDLGSRGLASATLQLSLTDLGAGQGALNWTLIVVNTDPTGAALFIEIFHYLDSLLGNDIGDETATLKAANVIGIVDPDGFYQDYSSSTAGAYAVTKWQDLRNLLVDGSPTNFADTGLPFGPQDFTGGFQQSMLNISPQGQGAASYTLETGLTASLPVELTAFDVRVEGEAVVLIWSTASETNNAGFAVEQELVSDVFREIGYVEGHGTTAEPQKYTFRVGKLDPGIHSFRLKQLDFDGAFEYSPVVEAAVTAPDRFVIESAYPNPFNPATTLRFAVAAEQHVEVTLVNVTGQSVRTLYSSTVAADEMQSLVVDADGLPSGTYLVHFEGSGFTATERIILAK
jgi:hypothetical protein